MLTATEARNLSDKPKSKELDWVLEAVESRAKAGFETLNIQNGYLSSGTLNLLRKLGYHVQTPGQLAVMKESLYHIISWKSEEM